MGLRYATITGVARDDLPDGGAWLYAETVQQIHELNPDTGVENLIPDFNGKPDLLARGLRVPPRGARAQRRDGAADLQADPPGVPLRALARRDHPGPRVRPGHQVQPDPRHGRDPRGGLAGAARPARRRLRADHHHAVPPPLAAAPPRRAVGAGPRSSSSSRTRPTRSASPGSCPGRWCARRTAPAGSTSRPWRPARPLGRPDPAPAGSATMTASRRPTEQQRHHRWPRRRRPRSPEARRSRAGSSRSPSSTR